MLLTGPAPPARAESYQQKALDSMRQLPPFSPVFNKLLGSLAKELVNVSEVADWIEKDSVIAGQVLRTVNSSAYGLRGTVAGIRHAIAILGINKLRNMTLSLSVSRIFSQVRTPKSWSTAHYNLHAAACAIMADQLALYRAVDFGEGAFAAGLLHDIGRLVIAAGLPGEFALIEQMERETGMPTWRCEQEVLGFSHGELAGLILKQWNLPKPIELAAETHHFPPLASNGLLPLGQIVALANELVNRMGIAIVQTAAQPEEIAPILEEQGWGNVNEKITKAFVIEFEALRSAF